MAITKDNISQQIHKDLKKKILKQDFKSGDQLCIRTLAEEYNISYMPIRDALNMLDAEGMVEKKPRVGYFVKKYTFKEVKDIMETRKMFELYCIDNHFSRIDKDKISALLKKIQETEKFSRTEFNRLDIEFHDEIINASNNSYLLERFGRIRELVMFFRHLDIDGIKKANQYHISIMEAILAGNKEKTREILSDHIDNATKSILQYLSEEDMAK